MNIKIKNLFLLLFMIFGLFSCQKENLNNMINSNNNNIENRNFVLSKNEYFVDSKITIEERETDISIKFEDFGKPVWDGATMVYSFTIRFYGFEDTTHVQRTFNVYGEETGSTYIPYQVQTQSGLITDIEKPFFSLWMIDVTHETNLTQASEHSANWFTQYQIDYNMLTDQRVRKFHCNMLEPDGEFILGYCEPGLYHEQFGQLILTRKD